MRKGQNPAKFVKQVAKPQRITVAVLNYIPFLSGFYAQTLEVLKTNLGSIWQNSDLPYDLLVFDNGSCQEAIDFLTEAQDEGKIQTLILSEKNMGKGGAWNIMLNAAPGEIIAYTDNDAYFYPGWLSKSVQILETFPKVGMVTSRPFRTPPEFYTQTVAWAESTPGVTLERGQFIPWEAFRAFDMSLGTAEEEVRKRYGETEDVRLTYQGLTAQAGASHWQFLAYKSVLQQFLPFSMDRPMGQVRQLDQRMNDAGYLRLMPMELLAQNMSNRLDWIHDPSEVGRGEAGRHGGPVTKGGSKKQGEANKKGGAKKQGVAEKTGGAKKQGVAEKTGGAKKQGVAEKKGGSKTRPYKTVRKRLLKHPLVKRVLLGLYDRIFRWYYED